MNLKEKSFEYTSASSKLLITLSTGIIAYIITFLDNESGLQPNSCFDKYVIGTSWMLLLSSTITGIWVQLGIITVLEPNPKYKDENFIQTIRNTKIKTPFKVQIIFFALGVIATVMYSIFILTNI